MADTVTGLITVDLDDRIKRGIPRLYLCSHPDLAFMNVAFKQSAVASGSRFDGSAVLQEMLDQPPDEDTMLCRCSYLPEETAKEIIEYINDSPIYCHLNVTHQPSLKAAFPTEERNGKYYLSASRFREQSKQDSADDIKQLFGHNVVKETDTPGKASRVIEHASGSMRDVVDCIPCHGWPERAEFIALGSTLVSPELTQFHIVPKCRPGGDVNIEWRLSFTQMENFLVQHVWSQEDRVVFSLFKCLIKRHIKMSEFITTYHLKTIMLWSHNTNRCCRNLSQKLLGVIDLLLHRMVQRDLPLYFATDHNLLIDIPEAILEEAIKRISSLRTNLLFLPDHLGLYDRPMTKNLEQGELLTLMSQHAMINTQRGIDKELFKELGDLHTCPQTIMYIWESYLYKALDFIGKNDEQWVLFFMIMGKGFLPMWQQLILTARVQGKLLGYPDDVIMHNEVQQRLGITTGAGRIYYKTYNGLYFQMCERPWSSEDKSKSSIYCLAKSSGIYYDSITELVKGPTNEAIQNVYDVRNMLPAQSFDKISLKNVDPKKCILYDSIISRHAFIAIRQDLADGIFSGVRDQHADPHFLFDTWKKYMIRAVKALCPGDEFMFHQSMIAELSKERLLGIWRQLPGVAKSQPELFGYLATEDVDSFIVKKRLGICTKSPQLYQMTFNCKDFQLEVRNFKEEDLYSDTLSILDGKGDVYFQLQTKVICSKDSLENINRIVDRIPNQEFRMLEV